MEGLPMITCLIQHTLKTLCTCYSSDVNTSNKWVYSVFWRITPRIYPPPKWDFGGGVLDRTRGNNRNWILLWEDGFCDLNECERVRNDGSSKGSFGPHVFFKLSHEVYNYGEGLIGKVAGDNSHRWVSNSKDGLNGHDPSITSTWNTSIDPQPKAWEFHFNSGIKTIAIISIREGIIQLGSFDKIVEDLNLVLSIRRKFSYLRTIPGLFSIQRPFATVQHPYNPLKHKSTIGPDEAQQLIDSKVNILGDDSQSHKGPFRSGGLGYINHDSMRVGSHDPPFWPIPPLMPYNFGSRDHESHIWDDGGGQPLKHKVFRVEEPDQERKPMSLNSNLEFVMELGIGPKRIAQENNVNRNYI